MDIEDIDDDNITSRLSRVLRERIGTGLFNRLRDRIEATGVDDRVITLAIMTEMCTFIQSGAPVTLATCNTHHKLQVQVTDWRCVDELLTHGRLLDGPLF